MKVSPGFKQQIQKYLDQRAKTDILFSPIYDKENKNIDECISYILSEVKKKAGSDNAIAMTDEEIYSMAVHYYDEDSIKVDKSNIKSSTKVSHISDSDDHSDNEDDEVDDTTTQSNLTPEIKRKLILDDDDKGLFD
jgi:hypothetical protein